ncbi:hypothetical protein [endosymbiont GvMRE of Glomus versiforme]|uniref:hypothetical protein n=1 Tax=endosymbiont GvMRE of Glomus versiforme TaxID=2039283 RepID=UPI000EBEE47D|nr:hypothetical protein [endosymbiont GvMRE of Glomus versiforme]RHZ37258.1 hypothetical protein GvMRE_I1g95 [endosymbiont GvMRE of Glomus versiforme]RHZ37352.1 hypothetical protein GvMRE_I1g123 [endosymbiont GvMRE of Glomus versiforme]
MLKFRYHYLLNTLAYQQGEYWNEIPESRQFQGHFGSQGFMLENGWVSFTLYEKKIRAFYKDQEAPTWITYYRKDLPRQNEVIFTFTAKDEVEKINGKWRSKHA